MLLVKSSFISSKVRWRSRMRMRYQKEKPKTRRMTADVARMPAICRSTWPCIGSVVIAVQVVAVFVGLGFGRRNVARRAARGKRVALVQVRQAVGDDDVRAVKLVAQQAVVGGEVRGADHVQPGVQAALEVARQFLHRLFPSEERVRAVVYMQGRVDGGRVPSRMLFQIDIGRVALLLGGDGAALHVGRLLVISGGDAHFAVLPQ